MLGTIMVANVFFVIIPAHWELIRAKEAGREPDPAGGRPRQAALGAQQLPDAAGAVRDALEPLRVHVHARGRVARARVPDGDRRRRSATSSTCATRAGTSGRSRSLRGGLARGHRDLAQAARDVRPPGRPVPFSRVQRRSSTSAAPSATRCTRRSPASRRRRRGSRSTRPSRSRRRRPTIEQQAVVLKAMPLGNVTHMTQAERDALGAWIRQGANIP